MQKKKGILSGMPGGMKGRDSVSRDLRARCEVAFRNSVRILSIHTKNKNGIPKGTPFMFGGKGGIRS